MRPARSATSAQQRLSRRLAAVPTDSRSSPGTVAHERLDYWGWIQRQYRRDNFDELKYEYFAIPPSRLEAFRRPDRLSRREQRAVLATRYDFPAVKEGRVKLEEFLVRSRGIIQGFVFNTRREKFQDPRVRRAFNYAFDFEEANKQLFFGQYERITSYFHGSELASSGLPQGEELAILETVRDKVPPEVSPRPTPIGVWQPGEAPICVRAHACCVRLGPEVRNQRLMRALVANTKRRDPARDPSLSAFLFYKPLEQLGVNVTVTV